MIEGLTLDSILFTPPTEESVILRASDGVVPNELRGTYYLNGPANFRVGDFTYSNWLDGDGLVRALRFDRGQVEHRSSFIRTRKYQDEAAAGRPIYRGFGTAFKGDRMRRRIALESPVNLNVHTFANRLFAFGEQCLPCELSPADLKTLGERNFAGALGVEISPFSGHPKFDREAGRLCNFGLKYGITGQKLAYWEFDTEFRIATQTEVAVDRPYCLHDFACSERFAAFYLSPYLLDLPAFLRRGQSFFDALVWRPELANELIVIDRAEAGRVLRMSLGQRGYCLHLINAFDDGDLLSVDLIEMAEPLYPQYCPLPTLFSTVTPSAFVRFLIDTATGAIVGTEEAKQEVHLDFPTLPSESRRRKYENAWMLAMPTEPSGATKYYDRVVRFASSERRIVDTYLPPAGVYLAGEPAVARGGPETYLICPRWHALTNTSDYVILDPFDLSAPAVATLPLPHPSPLGFHASFAPAI